MVCLLCPGVEGVSIWANKPPNIMFTDRKYEPMGKVIMANVKARSL